MFTFRICNMGYKLLENIQVKKINEKNIAKTKHFCVEVIEDFKQKSNNINVFSTKESHTDESGQSKNGKLMNSKENISSIPEIMKDMYEQHHHSFDRQPIPLVLTKDNEEFILKYLQVYNKEDNLDFDSVINGFVDIFRQAAEMQKTGKHLCIWNKEEDYVSTVKRNGVPIFSDF